MEGEDYRLQFSVPLQVVTLLRLSSKKCFFNQLNETSRLASSGQRVNGNERTPITV